jgi:hypothetical protein
MFQSAVHNYRKASVMSVEWQNLPENKNTSSLILVTTQEKELTTLKPNDFHYVTST